MNSSKISSAQTDKQAHAAHRPFAFGASWGTGGWWGRKIISLAALASLALAGACSTVIYGPDGRAQFRSYADMTNVKVTTPGSTFSADRVSHSVPTRAALNGATSVITAAGAAVATGGGL